MKSELEKRKEFHSLPIMPPSLSDDPKKAYLYLGDGTIFEGFSFGGEKDANGEIVFTTSMNGYPESLTDPSYKGQILIISHPLVGNYGVPKKSYRGNILENFESEHIMIEGLVISELTKGFKQNSASDLAQWLESEGIPGIYGVDTRMLIKNIREHGVLPAVISTERKEKLNFKKYDRTNFVEQVSIKKPVKLGSGKRVVVVDFGVKHGILDNLAKRGLEIVLLPWNADPDEIMSYNPKGIVFGNGPGNPALLEQPINTIREIVEYKIPTLGICLGHQLIALALGGKVKKMKYGHRAINKSVIDLFSGRSYITTHNHGYALYKDDVPKGAKIWFLSNDDGVVEGMKIEKYNIMTVQFHPEARPGTNDTLFVFDEFARRIYGK